MHTHVCIHICTYIHLHTHTHIHTDRHTMEYYSAIKRMKFGICKDMDGPRGCYAKQNKLDKTNTICYNLYMDSKTQNKHINIRK